MPIPTYDYFIEPVLRFLAAHPEGAPAASAREAAALTLGISDDEKQQLLPSGVQPVYANRAGWAFDRLKRASLATNPRRGFWQLTPAGIAMSAQSGMAIREEVIRLSADSMSKPLNPTPDNEPHDPPTDSTMRTADERLEDALADLRAGVARDLRESLARVSPAYFERIVLELLHRMGYGATQADLQPVGGPGDGGIDGIISLDKLGLEKIYVQAKRWQANVGRPEILAFYGALAAFRAKKGVFITTAGFTD